MLDVLGIILAVKHIKKCDINEDDTSSVNYIY